MTWVKRGRLPHDDYRSHAQCPTVLMMDDRLRIFYADRDLQGRSFIASFDVTHKLNRMLPYDPWPIVPLGKPGTFDEDGMMPSCIEYAGMLYKLWYSGWNRGGSVPYRNAIGCLVSADGKNWGRLNGPIMDRSAMDPIMVVTPWVDRDEMWYVSGTRWVEIDGKLEPLYVIKHARANATHWVPDGPCGINPEYELEAFSNPTVIRTRRGARMWFCSRDSRDYRGGAGSYRIRSAHSADGVHWTRDDDGLDVSPTGWDSEMTCYPYVVKVDGRLLMFYNGNGFGKSGIGYAEWID